MKRTIQSVLMLVALWGALLTIALREGWEMPVWLAPPQRAPQSNVPAPPVVPSPPTQPATQVPSTPTVAPVVEDEPPAPELARYRVCRGVSPVLSRVQVGGSGFELAVHCGDALQLIAWTGAAPERIMTLALTSPSPAETSQATAIASGDLNADGLPDLVVPWLTVDTWKHPIGRGMLSLLRDPSGGFRPAARVLAGSPLQVVAGALDAQPGVDVMMLHATDESVRKPRQAWWVSGGRSPQRVTASELAAHSDSIALADLDRDGQLDVIAASPTDGRLDIVFGNGNATSAGAIQREAAGCSELLVTDLTGDAHDDLVCSGDSSYVIAAREDRELVVQPLVFGGERVRSLQAADFNADGKLDLLGYAHPQLVRLEQGAELHFEARMVAELLGTSFAPLAVELADFNHDGTLDMAMLGRAPDDAESVDLVIISNVSEHVPITVSDEASTLPDARFLLTPTLP